MGANTSSQFGTLSDSKSSTSFDTVTNACSTSTANSQGLFLNSSNESTINSIGLIFAKDRKLKKLKQKIKTKLKKSSSHSQVFTEFASLLSTQDLVQIYEEYRASFFMKELSLHAESARPIASTIRNDLSELFDLKHNSDITLIYKGVDFPVHKAIVCVRCPYFRELLGRKPPGSIVSVNLEIKTLRVELFNDLLKYLYSGELAGSYDPRSNSASYEALIRISQQCGVPNPLSHDLRYLLETGMYSDATLCFQAPAVENADSAYNSAQQSCSCCEQTEFSCHQAILSARSPFFRNVILRQQKRASTSNQNSERMKITLDESIIPRRLARVLLHVMYRDSENLQSLVQSSMCKCRTNTNVKDSQHCLVKEVMDLYEIARFLEIDFLVQSCEDMLVSFMNLDSLIMILKWSGQSHGSPWVKRQALTYLKEEFSTIINSTSLLYQLEYSHLCDALKSDFLEACELDILKSIIKWGEYHLVKKLEEREPNLLLSHSLTRKSLRKKEIDDAKLFESISDLIGLVRIGHILPIDSEYLQTVAKRGFIEIPSFMLKNNPANQTHMAWLRNNSNNHFMKPRFFTFYFEECKSLLEERIDRQISLEENVENYLVKNKGMNNLPIPDNLYMIEKLNPESIVSDGDLATVENAFPNNFHFCLTSSSSSSAVCYEDIDKIRPNLPVLEEQILYMMRQREQELRTSPFCIRALQVSHSRCEALRLIQLRVVREFGLPDVACELLHLKQPSTLPNADTSSQIDYKNINVCDRNAMPPPPPRPAISTFTNSNCDPFSYDSELKLEEISSQYELDTQV